MFDFDWSFHLTVAPPALKLHSKPTFFPSVVSPLRSGVEQHTPCKVPFSTVSKVLVHFHYRVPKQMVDTLLLSISDIYCSPYKIPLLDAFDILQTKQVKLYCLLSIFFSHVKE